MIPPGIRHPARLHGLVQHALGHTRPTRVPRREPVLLGRQPIFTANGDVFGCELLYRSPAPGSTAPDTWTADRQDRATSTVVRAALECGLTVLCGDLPVFVNATRSLLTGAMGLPDLPTQLGIEVVESVEVDDAVLRGVLDLRGRGHLIAVDDFAGLPGQLRLLPHVDIVKIDIRDLRRQGRQLLDRAVDHGARTVIERVETTTDLRRCQDLGFDLYQGNLLEPALVCEVTPEGYSSAC